MNDKWLEHALDTIRARRIAVLGDFCLDAYWLIDSDQSELSVETHLPIRRVRQQKYTLGGAANVVANLAALNVAEIHVVGLIGNDPFGERLLRMLGDLGVATDGLLSCQDDWQTFVFGKPHIDDQEQNRIDFGGFNTISSSSIAALATELDRIVEKVDIVILNQQIPAGVSTPEMITALNAIIAKRPECKFISDSRHRAELYQGTILKLNAHEAARVAGEPRPRDDRVTAEQARKYAKQLYAKNDKPAFVTRGENGIIVVDEAGVQEVPGLQIIERTDPVGAGDTTVATIAAVLGGGGDCLSAAKLANISASITVRKLQTTGTATPDEISRVGPNPDYIYLPELADDSRRANHIQDTEIEVIHSLPDQLNIRHAIFDHDGTISTLRQGWEQIMEPMMVRVILGPQYENADEVLYHKVVDTVRRFIDKTTGIQTLAQMQYLVDLVKQFGCVPANQILDIHGYKEVYNGELLKMVNRRIKKLERGELNQEHFQIAGARQFLEKLHAAGVKLYLASGTDTADVVAEAQALGYAHLFEGQIFGAVGDVKIEAKRVVMERIIAEHKLVGHEFVTFGDGPVETRETHRCGGIAIGVASDEVRRFGPNFTKRARLIRAGADLIISDFTELKKILNVLQKKQ